MDINQVIELIRQHGVQEVARVASFSPAAMLERGWNLTRWRAQQTGGAVLFVHIDQAGLIDTDPRILCVNAPESDRARWEALVADADATVMVLMAPGGKL